MYIKPLAFTLLVTHYSVVEYSPATDITSHVVLGEHQDFLESRKTKCFRISRKSYRIVPCVLVIVYMP